MMPFLCIINAPYTPMIPSADAHFLTFLALPPLWEVSDEPLLLRMGGGGNPSITIPFYLYLNSRRNFRHCEVLRDLADWASELFIVYITSLSQLTLRGRLCLT